MPPELINKETIAQAQSEQKTYLGFSTHTAFKDQNKGTMELPGSYCFA